MQISMQFFARIEPQNDQMLSQMSKKNKTRQFMFTDLLAGTWQYFSQVLQGDRNLSCTATHAELPDRCED